MGYYRFNDVKGEMSIYLNFFSENSGNIYSFHSEPVFESLPATNLTSEGLRYRSLF